MSRPTPQCLSRRLRLLTPSRPHPICTNSIRALAQTPVVRTFASDRDTQPDSNGRKDFKGQLWQSTSERIARERAEQDRYSRMHAEANPKSNWAGPTLLTLVVAGFAYLAGTYANPEQTDSSTLPLSNTPVPSHDTSEKNLSAAWTDLKNIVGQDNISTSVDDIDSHSGSAWSSYPNPPTDRPFCILRPGSTEEVSAIMKVLHQRRIPVTAYSGGTSLEGHFSATRGGVCIDFSRMDQVLALHAEDLDVVVQPALGWEALNDVLSDEGLFFPPDPGPGAMIGGMVGTGCSGTNAYRYGTMRDWVISLTVVLADGKVIKTRQRPRKSSAGYDLTRTFIGSEGTLGLVTEATLKVTSAPQNPRVAVASFPSVRHAADCVFKVVRQGVPIAAVELLDDVQMKCINDAGATSKTWKEAPTLFFKFSGTATAVKESIGLVQSLASQSGSKSFEFAKSQDEAQELWSARKDALWSVMAKKKREEDHVWTTDVAVPISKLPDIIDVTKRDMRESGVFGSIVGHVGDGNFHAIILYNDNERQKADGVVHRMVRRAIEMEGTATGEHGVGLVKRDYLEHELGKDAVDAMRLLKRSFDPLCLLNCDKVVRSQTPKRGEVQAW
ncbi:MAG: D-lactate ferricytochrome c oxidoreductase [Chrysothrix sp. TS-e1954]|nr:MAG: D-lactate ferricytochrome c oxidoreductase [Chrysothrix sp. TS-e1954]